jgi:hypothetical protein
VRETCAKDLSTVREREGGLVGEALGSAGLGFGCFLLAIPGRRTGSERAQEAVRDSGNFVDGRLEGLFVRLGWFVETCDFPHELERSGANLVIGDWRLEIEERSYVSAHWVNSLFEEKQMLAAPDRRR